MVRDALTGYWSLVSGLTEVTVERARAAAKALAAQGEATREQVGVLAQEIVETSRANREALVNLVRYEAERAAERLGFASSDEMSRLQGRVRDLERSIAELRTAAGADSSSATPPSGKAARATKAAKATEPAKTAEPAKATESAKAAEPAKAATKAPPAKASKAAPAKAAKASSARRVTPRKRAAAAAAAAAEGPGTAS